jgi:hypothetical protein
MGIGRIHARDLDRMVADVDARGGLGASADLLSDFDITYETKPDITLDPFSE